MCRGLPRPKRTPPASALSCGLAPPSCLTALLRGASDAHPWVSRPGPRERVSQRRPSLGVRAGPPGAARGREPCPHSTSPSRRRHSPSHPVLLLLPTSSWGAWDVHPSPAPPPLPLSAAAVPRRRSLARAESAPGVVPGDVVSAFSTDLQGVRCASFTATSCFSSKSVMGVEHGSWGRDAGKEGSGWRGRKV